MFRFPLKFRRLYYCIFLVLCFVWHELLRIQLILYFWYRLGISRFRIRGASSVWTNLVKHFSVCSILRLDESSSIVCNWRHVLQKLVRPNAQFILCLSFVLETTIRKTNVCPSFSRRTARLLICFSFFNDRGSSTNFPRSWLLPVMADNIQDTELKYFFDTMLPLAANLRSKGIEGFHVTSPRPCRCP